MSGKQKYSRTQAVIVAESVKAALLPFCHRIEVAGSLRRGKQEVGDVELLFVPRREKRPKFGDMFAEQEVDLAGEVADGLVARGFLARRLSKAGVATWGPANKLAVHVESGMPVDLFSTSDWDWWVSLVIRTGSKETNLRLTTGAQSLGRHLYAYGSGVSMPDGRLVRAVSERHVFELCGVTYMEPEER